MFVRCRHCDARLSEWAGWCPSCGHVRDDPGLGVGPESVADFLILDRPASLPVEDEMVVTADSGAASRHLEVVAVTEPARITSPPTPYSVGISQLRRRRAVPSTALAGPQRVLEPAPPRFSAVFARMVALPGGELGATLQSWWTARATAGRVTVQGRLKLGAPVGDGSARWMMKGRVSRSRQLHWIPVVLELWPVHHEYTKITLTPQVHVFVSRRYFRVGHSVLDRLSVELAEAAAQM